MMKRKLLCFLLLVCLLIPGNALVYAADYPEYSALIDEVAGMEEPHWSFEFLPEMKYPHKFLWFEYGEGEVVGWDIRNVSYYFTLHNEHEGEFLVGCNRSDLDITFEYAYSSMDEDGGMHSSSAVFTYPLGEVEIKGDYVEFVFPYDEVLSGSEYYAAGMDTVIRSVEIYISSRVMNKLGTLMHFDFTCEDYATQVYTGISYYKMTYDDMLLVSELCGVFKGDDDGKGDGNGGEIETHYFVSILPDSLQEDMFLLSDFMELLLIELPRMMWDVLVFLFELIGLLPEYIHKLLPFLPENVIAALMFCMVFGLAWGILKKWKKLKE